MSIQYCFNCGKEMRFAMSVADIEGYITCGHERCAAKARSNSAWHENEDLKAQKKAKALALADVIIFSSTNPEEEVSRWESIPKVDHPKFLYNSDVMAEILTGGIVNREGEGVYYRARTTQQVRESLEKSTGKAK